jgi:hypothetical protein
MDIHIILESYANLRNQVLRARMLERVERLLQLEVARRRRLEAARAHAELQGNN